jgi:uncharacterized membrane protein YphA (DoxX/SURF4 family)
VPKKATAIVDRGGRRSSPGQGNEKEREIMSQVAIVPAQTLAPRRVSRYLVTAARVALGLLFVVFGLNGFFNFLPPPSGPVPQGAMEFAGALMKTGYMFPLIKGTEVLAGALLLTNLWVPLALILLAPVLVNIVAFHAFLVPDGTGLALALVAIELILAWTHRKAFRPLFARG